MSEQTVGIRFKNSGRTYCFKAEGLDLHRGDRVVVESELGISIGDVAALNCQPGGEGEELKPVLRKVTEADIVQENENEEVKREAQAFGSERVAARGLDMKLVTTDVTLDRKRFIFYFVAEARIDFRELVKDLASKYKTRIELRQIGIRDAAKLAGGYGICGQEICCKSFLKSFAPISIKMAKQQDLVLNTCKLSGLCGRLLCCLNYEYDPERGSKKKRPHPAQTEGQPETVEAEAGAAVETPAPAPASAERQRERTDKRDRRDRRDRQQRDRQPQREGVPQREERPREERKGERPAREERPAEKSQDERPAERSERTRPQRPVPVTHIPRDIDQGRDIDEYEEDLGPEAEGEEEGAEEGAASEGAASEGAASEGSAGDGQPKKKRRRRRRWPRRKKKPGTGEGGQSAQGGGAQPPAAPQGGA